MRKLVALLFLTVALAATGVALSSGGPNQKLASETRVYGGGTFGPGCVTDPLQFCMPTERSFAIDAHVEGGGSGAAYGTWEYGQTGGPSHMKGDITCVTVVGNTAIVGGFVTQSERSDVIGLAFAAYVRDNGTTTSTTPDQASVGWFAPPGDWPASFPQTCPASGAFGVDIAPPLWFNVHGDVVVQP
jgi:hypothetical protein